MGIKVENGKNGGEPMEVQDKAQHVQGADQNDSDEEYHGQKTKISLRTKQFVCRVVHSDADRLTTENCFAEPGMRVGSEYQAAIPDLASDGKERVIKL